MKNSDEMRLCEFCNVYLADAIMENKQFICYICCDERQITHPPFPVVNTWLRR